MRNVDDDDDVVVALRRCDEDAFELAGLPALPPRAGVAEDGDDGR